MIEDFYRSIGKSAGVFGKQNLRLMFILAYMFPETANWVTSANEYVFLWHFTFRVLIPSIESYTSASTARFDQHDLRCQGRDGGRIETNWWCFCFCFVKRDQGGTCVLSCPHLCILVRTTSLTSLTLVGVQKESEESILGCMLILATRGDFSRSAAGDRSNRFP